MSPSTVHPTTAVHLAARQPRYDCVVIGSGPGGYVAAIRAAQLGMRTAVVEKDVVGGRCLNYACIPAKAMLRVADVLEEIRNAGQLGITVGEPAVDFSAVSARREQVIKTLTNGVSGLLKKNSIDVIEGSAALTGGTGLRVGEQELSATTVILATGSVKRQIAGTEFGGRVIGTEEAWRLRELPKSLVVVGAGASGTEIASAYARMGVQVRLLEGLDRVLPSEDADISKLAERGFRRQGIDVHTNTFVENIRSTGDSVTFTYGDEEAEAEWLVIAAGRGPDVEGLALDAAEVKLTEQGLIEVDGALRTSVRGVYAIGDLVPGPALAHKASDEGVIAVEDAAGLASHPLSHIDIPRATFCTPNVASFGLTEAQAREAGHEVVIGTVPYAAVGAGTVYGDRTGAVKIVAERRTQVILGGHIIGAKAIDLIQELVTARALSGGFSDVARIVHSHPTLSEAVMEAARAADGWLIHG